MRRDTKVSRYQLLPAMPVMAFPRFIWRAMMLVSLLGALLLAACASTVRPIPSPTASPTLTATPGPTPAAYNPLHPEREEIHFREGQGQTFPAAFHLATDLGLQPSSFCNGQLTQAGRNWRNWQPMVLPQYQAGATSNLFVELTPLTAPDWPARVRALPVVSSLDIHAVTMICPKDDPGTTTPPPGKVAFLSPGQDGTVARVSFAAPLDTYDAALAAVVFLGLRLADPCYEHARPTPPWHPMGQENAFAASHTLIVATTLSASNHWRAQLSATAGVRSITTPYTPTC